MRTCRITRLIPILISLLSCGLVQAASMNTFKDMKSAFAAATYHANVPDSEVVIFLNEGMQQVCTDLDIYQKHDTIITSDGNSDYSLNDDVKLNGVIHVELKNAGKRVGLQRVPRSEIGHISIEDGCPKIWCMHGKVVTVQPEGSARACTLIVRYNAIADYFTADTNSVNIIPVFYRYLAVRYALYRYYKSAGSSQNAAETFTAYQGVVARQSKSLGGVQQ